MDISFAFRKIQKSIAGFSILAVLASLVSFTSIASAESFDDVSSSHYAADAVDAASDEGWMTGYDNGDFGVDDYLTRGQAAKILVLGALGEDAVDEDYDAGFTDVSSSYSLENYVNTAELYGFVSGRTDADGDLTGEYDPNAYMNRAEFAKVAVEAFGLANVDASLDEFPDVDEGAWYEESATWYVSTAWAWSVINGYDNGNFYPAYNVTRGQAALMVNRAQEPEYRADDEEEEDPTSDGDLTVEVSDESPDAMTIPSNATSVELAAWDFTANGGDVTVDSLSVHHYGITSLASTHQVYLYEGSNRLTAGTTISSTDNEATFTYNIDVDSGETRTISVRMDMGDYTTTGEIGLEIASAAKVDAAGATVDGDFPAQADKHTISTTDAGTVTIEKNGNTDNPQVGEDSATVAKFKLSSATEAAGVEELGLYLAGSINTADVENFNLYVSGDDAEAIATVAMVDDLDVIRFDISGDFDADSDECENSDGYCIAKGASKSFYVTADFNTGRTDDTVKVYIDQSTDVFSRGALYGSGMAVTRTAYNGDTDSADTGSVVCDSTTDADCSYSLLEGGDITISSDGPSASDVATNARDVSVLDFSIVSVTDVTFDSFPITMDTSADTDDDSEGLISAAGVANFTDVKIVNTDTDSALYAGVDSSSFVTAQGGSTAIGTGTDDAAAYHLFTDDFEMEAGEELNLALTMDIANVSTLNAMTFTAGLDLGATYPQLKDSNNKTLTNSSVLVPSSAITSKTMTVKTPSLALSLASTPGIKTWVKGSEDVPFTGLTFACGDSNSCRVTDLTVQAYYDDDANADWDTASDSADHAVGLTAVVGSVWLEDSDGNIIAAAKSINSSTFLAVFDSVDWEIEAGETAVAYVYGDISNNATTQQVAFGISSAANVTVEDEDGNSFSATAGGSTTGTVNATTPTAYAIASSGGSLTVAVSSSTARENIVVAGATDVEIASFEFTSTLEAFTVENLSLNNRRSAITAALGDYDDNVVDLTIEYEDVDGTTKTGSGTLSNGTAQFSGLTFYVPADDSATMTVYADLNTISSGADAATFVDLAVAFNNFEAIADSSGETYKADKIDSAVAAASDLDFGTPTWIAADCLVNNASNHTTAAVGSSNTLVVDTCGTNLFPVGTLIMGGADTTWTDGSDSIFVLTAVSTATAMTMTTLDDDDAVLADNLALFYSLPGIGYFTGTNQMVVYESKPTLALASTSPSGSRSVSSTDDAFVFTVSANAQEKIQIRTGLAGDDENDVDDVAGAIANGEATITTTAGDYIDGSGGIAIVETTGTASDGVFLLDETYATTLPNTFSYVSFWMKVDEVDNDSDVDYADISVVFDDDTTPDAATAVALNASGVLANGTAVATADEFTDDTWVLFTVPTTGIVAADDQVGFAVTESTEIDASDEIFVDALAFHNEMLVVDLTADDDFVLATAGSGLTVSLKESGDTIAQGAVGLKTTSTASIFLVPGGLGTTDTYTTLEVAKGTSKTYTLTLDSGALLHEDAGVDDPLTFSIGLGTSASGTVTPGDFWWYETNATVRWVGNVSSTTLTSNTVKY
ncbi:MAG: S-layer homology domain-containing protein [Patescibacteria group bacterium]